MNKFKQQKELTIERIRKIKGFEKLPTKEVEEIIFTIKEFSRILFTICKSMKGKKKQMTSVN